MDDKDLVFGNEFENEVITKVDIDVPPATIIERIDAAFLAGKLEGKIVTIEYFRKWLFAAGKDRWEDCTAVAIILAKRLNILEEYQKYIDTAADDFNKIENTPTSYNEAI